jgi:transposase
MDRLPRASQEQTLTTVQPRHIGALPVLLPILDALAVRDRTNALVPSQAQIDLGQTLVLLILNRLLAPQPLYALQDWLSTTVLPQVLQISPAQCYDQRLGRALDRLYPHLGDLWAQILSQAIQVYALDLTVLHWDLTSIYFEGAYTDSHLAAYGYSRDHRPDAKQVTLQVDVTHEDAVPVLYAVLPGNAADITRPVPHLQALLRLLARPELADRCLRPILVSDCKMITPEAILACHRAHLGYLGPLPPSNASETLLRSVTTEELVAHPLAYRPARVLPSDPRFQPYQGVWRPYLVCHDQQQVCDRALIIWSAGKQRLDEQKRKTYLKRLLNGMAAIQHKLNTRRYKQRAYVEGRLAAVRHSNPVQALVESHLEGDDGQLQLTFRVNRGRLAAAQALDGRYVLATNAAQLDAEQVLQLFKGQDRVEKQFRAVKGPLRLHPLFVRSDARIEGLVLVTLLAVVVRAILSRLCRQHGLTLPVDRVLAAFASLQAVDLTWANGREERWAAPLTAEQAQVLQTLDWRLPAAYTALPALGR